MLAPSMVEADEARLTLGAAMLSFPSADPDAVPSIAALENPLLVEIMVRGGHSMLSQLTVQAGGDLQSGSDKITITSITWTAQGEGFVAGTLSKEQPQLVGQWLGNVNRTGNLWFWLENSWSYPAGDYSQSLAYTLIAY